MITLQRREQIEAAMAKKTVKVRGKTALNFN